MAVVPRIEQHELLSRFRHHRHRRDNGLLGRIPTRSYQEGSAGTEPRERCRLAPVDGRKERGIIARPSVNPVSRNRLHHQAVDELERTHHLNTTRDRWYPILEHAHVCSRTHLFVGTGLEYPVQVWKELVEIHSDTQSGTE